MMRKGIVKSFGRVYIAAGRVFDSSAPSGYRRRESYRTTHYALNLGRWGVHVSVFSRAPIV